MLFSSFNDMWQKMYGKLVQDSGFAVQICISHMNTGSCMPIFVTYIFNFVELFFLVIEIFFSWFLYLLCSRFTLFSEILSQRENMWCEGSEYLSWWYGQLRVTPVVSVASCLDSTGWSGPSAELGGCHSAAAPAGEFGPFCINTLLS